MAPGIISRRTMLLTGLGLAVTFALYAAASAGFGGALVSNLLTVAPVALAGAIAWWATRQFERGEAVRKHWTLIALGLTTYLAAGLTWAYYEVILRAEVPVPGMPDVFYVAWYPLIGAALVMGIRALAGLFDAKAALFSAFAIAAVCAALMWICVLWPSIRTGNASAPENVMNSFYPLADLLAILPLGIVLAYLTGKLGAGRLALPWRVLVLGLSVIVLADALYTIASATGIYASGGISDLFEALGYLIVGLGASVAVDVQRPLTIARVDER